VLKFPFEHREPGTKAVLKNSAKTTNRFVEWTKMMIYTFSMTKLIDTFLRKWLITLSSSLIQVVTDKNISLIISYDRRIPDQ